MFYFALTYWKSIQNSNVLFSIYYAFQLFIDWYCYCSYGTYGSNHINHGFSKRKGDSECRLLSFTKNHQEGSIAPIQVTYERFYDCSAYGTIVHNWIKTCCGTLWRAALFVFSHTFQCITKNDNSIYAHMICLFLYFFFIS